MTALDKRLEKLKELAELARAEQARHEPFAVVYPRSLQTGTVTLCYHPTGCYGGSQRIRELTTEQAKSWFANHPGVRCTVGMTLCVEWVHAFYQRCALYTPEQKERARLQDMESWPEVAALYAMENADAVIDALAELPHCWG